MAGGQKFTLTFDAQLNVGQMKSAVSQVQSTLNGLHLPQNITKGLQTTLDTLSKEIQSFEVALGKDITSKTDFNKLSNQAQRITDVFEKLKLQVRDLTGLRGADLEKLFPSSITKNITSATNAIKQYSQQIKQANNEVSTAQQNVDKLTSKLTDVQNKTPMTDEAWKQLKISIADAEAEVDKYKTAIAEAQQKAAEVEGRTSNVKQSSIWRQAQKDIETYKQALTEAEAKLKQLTAQRATSTTFTKQAQDVETLNNKLTEAQQKLDAANQALAQLESTSNGGGLQQLATLIGQLTGTDLSGFKGNLEDLGQVIQNYINQQVTEATSKLGQLKGSVDSTSPSIQEFSNGMRESANAMQAFDDRTRDISALKSRIQYFFGLNNAINLVKRAIRGAFDTIKDLDKAMTETAVVTDFSVSDMWEQLPEYTKRANELGVTTQAAYEAATLYYQQGLSVNEVNALSVETLKMARIAGLDAAEATDRMTNALRGFNMELNTTNAQRVDDVYSELAANTASNVDEISTAMTKVASLAHSANMEFETTAAFLAQIIETTRESAETAGTALKTVVARFSEVKKLVDTNQLKGTDEEGNIVDVNKVSEALRTAGIDLNKYFLGEVGLDDIFMELASKWDSLTSVQQRYIATQAAGSRQQSRFIALMQDYARMQELVGKAYNSSGASARQFAKTQESLESKLARLKNAWNEFLMGLTNNVVIKGFVDLLTDLLNVVNKLTSAFGDSAGSVLKWITAILAFKGIKGLFAGGGLIDKVLGTAVAGTGLGNALFGSKILSGTLLGGRVAAGSAAATGGVAGSIGLGSLIGGAAKNIWGSAKGLGTTLWGIGNGGAGGAGWLFGGAATSGAQGLAAGLAGVATALGAVAVAVGVVVSAYQAWLRLTPEGQLKQAKQLANVMNTVADNTEKNASEFQQATESYKQYDNAVKSASDTLEYQKAVADRTDYVTQLIKENPNIAKYVEASSEGGQFTLTINQHELEAATKEAAENASKAAIDASFSNALVAGKQANVYEAQLQRAGVNIENQTIINRDTGVTRSLTESELAKYSETQREIENARAQEIAYAQQAYAKQLEGSGLEDDISNLLSNALAKGFDENQYLSDINDQRAKNWWSGQATRKQLEAQYFNLYGQQPDSSMKRGELARAVATAQVDRASEAKTNNAIELVKTGVYDDILKAMAGEIDFSDEDMENANDKLKLFADALGRDITEVEAQIKQGQKVRQEIKKGRQTSIYERLLRSGAANEKYSSGDLDNLKSQEAVTTAVDNYTQFLSTLDDEGIAAVERITAQADTLLGDKLGEFMSELPELYGTSDFNAVSKLFDSIDLDKPIQAFAQLQQYADDTTSAVGRYAAAIKEANAELFTSSNLVKSFIASADYEAITDQLAKFVEENEAITADNIEELSESCSDLKTLLDEDVASAEALAEAFTLLEKGQLTFDAISDALLKALDAGKSFETMIAEVDSWVDDFDQGNDLAKGADHVVSVLEDLKEYVENWEFGNEPVENIYDHLFGEGEYQNFLESFGDFFDPEQAESILTEQIERFTTLFENEGLGAIEELAGQIPGLTALGNDLFNWDLSEIGSTTEAINQVAEALGITEGAAESLILAWQTHIPGLRKEWNNLAFEEQVTEYANNLGDAKAITEQQLAALAAATGHSVDEIKAKLTELANIGDIEIPVIVNFQDNDGKPLTGDSLYNRFANSFGSWSDTNHMTVDWGTELAGAVIQGFEDGITTYDPTQVLTYFTERGLDTSQAAEMANRAISEVNGQFSQTVEIPVTYKVTEDDEEIYKTETKTVTVTADTVEGLDAAVNTALEAANYESVATAITEQNYSGLTEKIVEAGKSGGEQAASLVQSALNGITVNQINIPVYYEVQNPEALTGGNAALGGFTVSVAKGGLVKSYGEGSANRKIQPGLALTGEEGPEIVWNKEKGYAYITGKSHPQFQNLKPGDRVFNASETKKILNGSAATGGLVNSYATGGWKRKTDDSGSGSGSSSSSNKSSSDSDYTKESTWRNELDWLYDLMEDIAEYERQQTIIQSKYELAVEDLSSTGRDLFKLTQKELVNLQTQLKAQETAYTKRLQQMGELQTMVNAEGYGRYVQWNQKDQTLEIDWDAIEAIQDKDTYDEITDWIDRMEEVQDQLDDANETIWDIKQQIQELQDRYLEKYLDFQDRVMDAVVAQYQSTIDNFSELNDRINDTNSAILDSIQKEIDLERQIRDNTDIEKNITDMEARLAYMQRDTTGANEGQIRALEKQLEDARESYSDTLVDQAVDRLSEANDAASAQREKQIELMQAQLDYWQESGGLWGEVANLIASGFASNGSIITGSDLWETLKKGETWDAMSAAQKKNWANELILETNEVGAHLIQISDGNTVNSAKVRASIADERGILTQNISAAAETVRATISSLTGSMGGTPEHSYTAVKTDDDDSSSSSSSYTTSELNSFLSTLDDNFLRLADVMPAVSSGTTNTTNNYGSSPFNVNVNVGSIASDYDVDNMINRIKDELYNSASYRTGNSLSFIR